MAIFLAAARAARPKGREANIEQARAFLEGPEFILSEIQPARVEFGRRPHFSFASPRPTAFLENNVVRGRLYRCERCWQERPTVILLHGWNDIIDHRWRFPAIARQINCQGINAVTLEAPYHFQRRPRRLGAWGNFLCPDLLRTARAAAQSIAEIQSVAAWLREEGCPEIGLWGVSLGAWLAGLAICHDARWTCAVLMAPIARLDRVLTELPFCRHIRGALKGRSSATASLNLTACRPAIPAGDILLIESEHDLFMPKETIEELWRAWEMPEIWRVPQGHISVLGSFGLSRQIIRWIASRVGEPVAK